MKSDGTTWREYVFGGNETENISEKNTEFAEAMSEETRRAVRESDVLDGTNLDVESNRQMGSVDVEADGWEMDEDDVVRVRDALREADVGDETVGVVCYSRPPGSEGPGSKPDFAPRGVEVRTWEDIERENELMDEINRTLNAVVSESGEY